VPVTVEDVVVGDVLAALGELQVVEVLLAGAVVESHVGGDIAALARERVQLQ
jgi:hypothetical protein